MSHECSIENLFGNIKNAVSVVGAPLHYPNGVIFKQYKFHYHSIFNIQNSVHQPQNEIPALKMRLTDSQLQMQRKQLEICFI